MFTPLCIDIDIVDWETLLKLRHKGKDAVIGRFGDERNFKRKKVKWRQPGWRDSEEKLGLRIQILDVVIDKSCIS